MLRACLDRLLEEPCDLKPGPAGQLLRSQAVAIAVIGMHSAYVGMSTEAGPPLAAVLLQCLQSAAAASIWWLQQDPIDPGATRGHPAASPLNGWDAVWNVCALSASSGRRAACCL